MVAAPGTIVGGCVKARINGEQRIRFECQHLDQIRRYYEELRQCERSCHDAQLDLFAGDDAQF